MLTPPLEVSLDTNVRPSLVVEQSTHRQHLTSIVRWTSTALVVTIFFSVRSKVHFSLYKPCSYEDPG